MEAKHTKGEWQANAPNPYADESAGERRTYHWVVRTSYEPSNGGACGHQVCEISSMNTGTEEADARLIAAAPELLEALQAILRSFPTDGDMRAAGWEQTEIDLACRDYEAARAAVAKATQ